MEYVIAITLLLALAGFRMRSRIVRRVRQMRRKMRPHSNPRLQEREVMHFNQLSERLAAIQGMLAPLRDPEMIQRINNLGVLLRHANRTEGAIRPYQLRVLMRQAEAATKAYVLMPTSDAAKRNYVAHITELAQKLAQGEDWGKAA